MSAIANANPRNLSVKRIMKEYAEFQKSKGENDYFTAAPCEDNLFEWHFTIRGPPDSDFAGGRYHGRILLPSQYPLKPPDIMMLTPSGRFETNTKICLSISSFHPKNWQPSWSIRTVLTALIAFFPTPGNGAIGSLEYSSHERKEYAARSGSYKCELCGLTNLELLPDLPPGIIERSGAPKLDKEVLDTIAANKSIPPIAGAPNSSSSQPTTPGMGPTSVPSTPVPMSSAQRMIQECPPSAAASPSFMRSHSEPVNATANVPDSTLLPPPATELTTPNHSVNSSTTMTGSPAPLHLDEGLRQRQGVVRVDSNTPAPSASASSSSSTASSSSSSSSSSVPPAAAAPTAPVAVAVAGTQPLLPPQQRPAEGVSTLTVLLAFLIIMILIRKLYASTQAKAAFSFDFSQD